MTSVESDNKCRIENLATGDDVDSINSSFKYKLPEGTSFLESQVAGHPFDRKKNTLGMFIYSILSINSKVYF